MTSNSELILGSVSESGVNETVYNLSLDYATNMRKCLGGQISGVIYIMVDGKSVMLSIDSLMKGTAAPESIWQPEHPESRQVELIIPNYKEQPKPSSLGGAIDMISTDNYGSRKVNRKFEMDFAGRDARRLNGNLGNFIIFFKKICQDPDVRNTTRENYMYTYSKMLDFASLADFNDVNFDFLKKFEHWLSAHCGCTQNTIAKHVKVLRKAVNQAIRLGYIDVRNNPFFEYSVKVKKTEKEVLSLNDLALIDSYFHQHFDGMGERDREILGAFLFACYTGLRFSDLCTVLRKNIVKRRTKHWLVVDTQKTGKVVKIPLDDIFGGRPMEILRRFNRKTERLFALSANAVCYRRIKSILKRVHKQIKYKHISFHTARRTMSTLLLALQVPITSVQTLLGHSSVKTTEVYTKVKEQTVYNDIKKCKSKSLNSIYERACRRIRKKFRNVILDSRDME